MRVVQPPPHHHQLSSHSYYSCFSRNNCKKMRYTWKMNCMLNHAIYWFSCESRKISFLGIINLQALQMGCDKQYLEVLSKNEKNELIFRCSCSRIFSKLVSTNWNRKHSHFYHFKKGFAAGQKIAQNLSTKKTITNKSICILIAMLS